MAPLKISLLQKALISNLLLSLLGFSNSVSAKTCNFDWRGSWQETAEGRPISIYTIERGTKAQALRGVEERYDKSNLTLYEASNDGNPVKLPLSKIECSDRSIDLLSISDDGSTTSMRATIIRNDEAWIEIADLPDGYISPKYLFRRIKSGASLVKLASPTEGLTIDLWGVETIPSNVEMAEIFRDDQAIRNEIEALGGWLKVKDNDAFMQRWRNGDKMRIEKTSELLKSGQLKSGVDFYRAAFLFQHGDKPDDYLKAHNLAIISLSLGYKDAAWISAATLDRYLQNIGQPQIYGTQFKSGDDGAVKQEPFNFSLISDPERKALSVPVLSEQGKP